MNDSNNENLKLAFIYGRNSTDKQEDSQFQQEQACERFAISNGFTVVSKYYDSGFSGGSMERPNFKQMLDDLKEQRIPYLISYSHDRIARNMQNALYFFDYLDSIDCQFISVIQPNFAEDSVESNLSRNIQLSLSEYYLANSKRLVSRAMKSLANRGLFTGGVPPLGYSIVDKKYVINEDSEAISIMFEMIAKNASYKEISETLNQKGFRLRSGKPFSNKTIYKDYISNRRYYGLYCYGSYEKSSNGKRFNRHRPKPLSEQIVIPNGIPAIVSKELWDQANKVLSKRRQRSGQGKAKRIYLLSGKVFCACGHSMHGNSRLDGSKKYECSTYDCSSKNKTKDCKGIKRETIEDYILKNINYFLNDEIAVKIIHYACNYTIKKYYNNSESSLKTLEKRLAKTERVLNNLTTALGNEENTNKLTTVLDRIKDLETDKSIILKEIAELSHQDDGSLEITEEEIKKILHEIFVESVGVNDRRLAGIVDKCVDTVIVDKESIRVNYDMDVVFARLNKYIRLSVVILRTELKKEINTLYYELADIYNDEVKINYKVKKTKEKRQLIFQEGIYKEVVSL